MSAEEKRWWVCYEALGQKVCAGPYSMMEVYAQYQDIKRYEGVSGVFETRDPPAEYLKLGAWQTEATK